ncbi:tripartite tricarboxylate transporter TctB family protein [Micromonospora sp. NPDC005161]
MTNVDGASAPEAPAAAGASRGRAAGLLVAERSLAVLCLVASTFIFVRAEALVSHSSIARDGAFPPHAALWLGSAVLGLSSIGWLVQLRRAQPTTEVTTEGTVLEALTVFAIALLGAWLAGWLGLLTAAGVTYLAVLFYYREGNKLFIFGSCAAYLVLLHYSVEVLLRVPLPRSPYLPLPF